MFRTSSVRLGVVSAVVLMTTACGAKEDEMNQTMDSAAAAAGAPAVGSAEYTLVFRSTWTPATHPVEYPAAGALTGPHFSGLIGASHNTSFSLFTDGTPPSPGLERLSEEGKHDPLDAEIRAATGAGGVGTLFESGPLRDFADSVVTTVTVDEAHPLISFAAMVAPSPDWFTGASSVNLLENGAWVPSRTITLNAWDSGGDDGVTYKSADRNTDPKKPTMQAATKHFVVNGQAVPVATVVITRK
jgi:hypothetical protein